MFNQKEYMKEYSQLDKEKERKKQWRLNHPEYRKQYMKQWHLNNKETEDERLQQWRIDNKEHAKEYGKQYYQTPKGKTNRQRNNTKRIAKEKEIVNTLTSEEWIDILKKYKFKCAYCDMEFNLFDKPEKDHVIPISKNGDNTKENVVPACRSCNAKKYNKLIKPTTIL